MANRKRLFPKLGNPARGFFQWLELREQRNPRTMAILEPLAIYSTGFAVFVAIGICVGLAI